MNLPNKLTLLRIVLTFVMTACLTIPELPFGKTAALLIFIVAALTDYWDGRLARRGYGITPFGQLMDPVADKIMVSAAFVCFVALDNIIPAWIVIVIISREFLITGLRLLAVSDGIILQASRLGKHKTVWQIITIIIVMIGLALRDDFVPLLPQTLATREYAEHFIQNIFPQLVLVVSLLVAFLTILSGTVYLYLNRHLLSARR